MKKFEEQCKKKFNNNFVKCTPAQRKEWLQLVEKNQDMPEDLLKFYESIKQLTIRSFTTSKDYMVNIRKLKLAPGPVFKGCVPVKRFDRPAIAKLNVVHQLRIRIMGDNKNTLMPL